ncbi:MAG TPA: alpha/beta fold hydrolase [Reyranella sp.]|jgi:pimeloyl-ACP methyl ester carboxylesterase
MICRRALIAAGLSFPLAAAAKSPWKGYYAAGTRQRAVRFAGSDGAILAGTLLLPVWSELQRVPGIVLVAGSGPTDRDGNNPLVPQHIDVLKLIAELLAAAGIATLRYDKRGIGGSTARPRGMLGEQERFFSWDNFVGDVAAAHGELVKHDEIKPYATALLGHSEGGLLALAAMPAITKNRPHGMVLASTPGRPMSEIVREQVNRGAPSLVDAVTATMAAIEASGRVPADLPLELQALFPAYAGPYLQRMLAFDPAQALLGLDLACLLLQGAADRQVVPMGDVQPLIDALSKRSAPGEAVIIPAVSHNLKLVSWPSDTGYGGPLAPAVAAKLVDWLVPMLGA